MVESTEGIKEELGRAARRHRELRAAADQAGAERDRLVREASASGLSRRLVAELAGLTVGRVQQIVSTALASAITEPLDVSGPALAPQHMQALARANRVRLARAELKRAIGRGEIDLADVIEDCPWEAESMTVAELLTSQARWGRTRARRLLQEAELSEDKRLGVLTPRQRALLASNLSGVSG